MFNCTVTAIWPKRESERAIRDKGKTQKCCRSGVTQFWDQLLLTVVKSKLLRERTSFLNIEKQISVDLSLSLLFLSLTLAACAGLEGLPASETASILDTGARTGLIPSCEVPHRPGT